MKRIFTLLFASFLSIALFASAPASKSKLTIKSNSSGDIRVVIDGRRFEPKDNSMVINQLANGFHSVKVYRQKSNGFHSIFGKRYEVVYSGSVMVKPNTHVRIMIDRNGRAMVDERRVKGNSYGNFGKDRNRNDRDNDWDDNWDSRDNFDFDRDGQIGDYDDRDRNHGGIGYSRTISDRDFNQVLSAISKEWYEGNKAKSAQQIISSNFFTSMQVRQMLQLFTFENNKLDLAKQAYAKTVDQRSFLTTVDDVFSFETSRDELARYIRNIR